MSVPEVGRRLVDGVWVTNVEEEGDGGSQPGKLYKCHVDFSEFDTDGQTIDLFETVAGDVLLNIFYDPATAVNWDDSGTSRAFFAETPPGPTVHGEQNYGFLPLDALEPGSGTVLDMQVGDGTASTDHYVGGQVTNIAQQVFVGGVFTIANNSGGGDATQGEIDLFFEIGTPTVPVRP